MIEQYKLMQYDDTSELPNEPDDPESPETPEEEPSFPSKEYAGNDIPLNKTAVRCGLSSAACFDERRK